MFLFAWDIVDATSVGSASSHLLQLNLLSKITQIYKLLLCGDHLTVIQPPEWRSFNQLVV